MEDEKSTDKLVIEKIFSIDIFRNILKGAGQVMFQNSAVTGFFFLIGIFWGAFEEGQPAVAWGAIAALTISTVTGYILKLPDEDGNAGLWGFNGILVGCGIFTFLGNTVFSWLAMILCAAMSTWLRAGFNNVLAPFKINSLTFPFVFSTWIFLLSARVMHAIPPEYMSVPSLPGDFNAAIDMGFGSLVIYWLKGIGQVFLINSWITGIFFLIGLFLCSRWAAMWAAIASALSLFIILVFKGPGADIENGLYGFSAVLTGIALGMTFYKPCWRSAIWCVIGIIATVFVQAGMNVLLEPLGLPTLTGPFCVTTWLFLLPLFKFNPVNKEDSDHRHWHK